MRGLLIKDMELTLTNKRTLPIFILITIMLLFTGDGNSTSFAVAFLTMVCGMLVISSISYDEFEHGTSYLLTLPITRTMYVAEKYVFTLIAMLVGLIFSMAATLLCTQLKGAELDMGTWLIGCAATFAVLFVIITIMIPIQLKFGGENGRIVLIAFMAIIFILVFAGARIADRMGLDVDKMAEAVMTKVSQFSEAAILGIIGLVLAAIVAVSYGISNHIMNKKEF